MPLSMTGDLFEGYRGSLTAHGWEFYAQVLVEGVTTGAALKFVTAWQAVGMPYQGQRHPAVANCYLQDLQFSLADPTSVRIEAKWTQGERQVGAFSEVNKAQIEITGTLGQVETNKDIDGNPVKVTYTYPADYPNSDYAGKTMTTSRLFNRPIGEHGIVFTRVEPSNPMAKSKDYLCSMNSRSVPWSPDDPAKTWLCTQLSGRSSDGAESYVVTYAFQYKSDGWNQEQFYIDPNTGAPPEDLEEDVGAVLVKAVRTMDFNNLRLPRT